MGSLKLIVAATLITGLGVPLARAADMGMPLDPVPAQAEQMVELGTGWYLRGDVAFTKDMLPKISSDLNLIPDAPSRNSWALGIGGGYKFNNWFRADATFDYLGPRKANGIGGAITCPDKYTGVAPTAILNFQTCGVGESVRVHRFATLANGYLDLGSWSGISPYVGAGIGMSHSVTSGSVNYYNPAGTAYTRTLTNPNTLVTTTYKYDVSTRSKQYQLAWALMGGVTVDVAAHTQLDLGYRYINLGMSKGLVASTGVTFSRSMTEHQFRAGIRYMID